MKIIKKVTVLLLSLILVLQLTACNDKQTSLNSNTVKSAKDNSVKSSELTDKEIKELSEIDDSLCQNPQIIQLKKMGYLDDFIKTLKAEYKKQKNEEISDRNQELTKWGLDPQTATVYDLEKKAQDYLDKHYNGIKTDSKEFNDMVKKYLYDDSYGVASRAKEEPQFGPLYAYMCIYDDNITDKISNDNSSYKLSDKICSKKLSDIIEDNFKNGFIDTQFTIILNEYMVKKNIQIPDYNKEPATTSQSSTDASDS